VSAYKVVFFLALLKQAALVSLEFIDKSELKIHEPLRTYEYEQVPNYA
jgi:hypothetical protein